MDKIMEIHSRGKTLRVYNKIEPSGQPELFNEENSSILFQVTVGEEELSFPASVKEVYSLIRDSRDSFLFSHIQKAEKKENGLFQTDRMFVKKDGHILMRISNGCAQARKNEISELEEVEGTFREEAEQTIYLKEDDYYYLLFKIKLNIERSAKSFTGTQNVQTSEKTAEKAANPAKPKTAEKKRVMKRVEYIPIGQFLQNADGTYNVAFKMGDIEHPVIVQHITEEMVEAQQNSTPLIGEVYVKNKQLHLYQP